MTTQEIWQSVRPIVCPWMGSSNSGASTENLASGWSSGDWAVYRKSKRSTHPGRRAIEVKANSKGETYAYVVDKFWIVDEVLRDQTLILRTARGKRHRIRPNDPNLVRPSLLMRLRWADRFRQIESQQESTSAVTQ